MARNFKEKRESLNFYKYVCQKIGSEEDVRIRRMAYVISDIGNADSVIISGSKGEGLNLNNSDLDVMFIDRSYKVYDSETEVVLKSNMLPLIINTDETQPCFTQLCLVPHCQNRTLKISFPSLNPIERNHLGYVLSSDIYKQIHLPECFPSNVSSKIHGPCISDKDGIYDVLWFNTINKENIISILTHFYAQGIDCFASSETLQDYQNQSNESTESLISRNSRLLQQIMPTFHDISISLRVDRVLSLLYNFLHSSRTGTSRGLFALQISKASTVAVDKKQYQNIPGNKHCYFSYKNDLSHLVIGLNADAVSGLLKLASFFYVHKNYEASLIIISYTLQKCTDEKIDILFSSHKKTFNPIQKHLLNLMKKEKLPDQLTGETNTATRAFKEAADSDEYNITSAASRISSLI
ncbi:unnamed protein product [Mytilus edulis]|uniref:Uncharacterized protein n=1 Tax=Mytilus edulis TaxID=6550 RepID=A0A8S3SZ60_MYTED|nr:unnamed protein product [Mytilus edulis]